MTVPSGFTAIKSNRQAMVNAFDITPVRRFQCLPNKPVRGLYKTIRDEAYQFTAISKGAAGPLFVFYTGHKVGGELLGLLGESLPPLETWQTVLVGGGGAPAVGGVGGGGQPLAIHPFNASLLSLLNLFFLRYEFDPTKPSGQIFSAINSSLGTPQFKMAVALNTVLLKCRETSATLIAWLHAQVGNVPVRNFNFAPLSSHLKSIGTQSIAII